MNPTRTLIYLLTIAASAACAQSTKDTTSFAQAAALQQAIEEEQFRQITSVLVAVDGELIYEQYWAEGNSEKLNDTRSAMKTLVAIAAGAAIDDGHLPGTDAQAFGWFEPERPFRFSTKLKNDITLLDLLTMSSALDCNDDIWESPGNEEHMYPARHWTYFVVDMPTRDNYQRDENGNGPFSYCTAGSFILGQIIQRASGQQVDAYIEERLLQPIGITEVAWDRSPTREVMTGGGAEMTSRDLLKLGQLLLDRGEHDGEQVVSATWVSNMLRKHRVVNERQNYGLQIWHEDYQCGRGTTDVWYMGGNGGNKIAIFPDLDAVAVVTSTLYSTRGMHQQSQDILEDYVLPSIEACGTTDAS